MLRRVLYFTQQNRMVRAIRLGGMDVTTVVEDNPILYSLKSIIAHPTDKVLFGATNLGIVKIDPNTKMVMQVVGSSSHSGGKDGPFHIAEFSKPIGLHFLTNDLLVIADDLNDRLRVADFRTKSVWSICNGNKAKVDGTNGADCSLKEPRSVTSIGSSLYVGGWSSIRQMEITTTHSQHNADIWG